MAAQAILEEAKTVIANLLIGLREGLEAALVVGILIAYVRKTNRTHLLPKIWAGIACAVIISLAFGAFLTFGPNGLTFEAQEAIGGGLSIIAVGFVTWMIFWMAANSRSLSKDLSSRLDTVQESTWGVVLLAALSVGREGLETALFIWAASQAAGSGSHALLGALTGILIAIVLAWLLMRGALKLNLSKFFTWTGAFLIFVAAGVLAYGVHDLQEAAILPGLNSLAFDVSETIPPSSFIGTLLKGVFNFSPATTWLEALVWLLYVAIVLTFFIRSYRVRNRRSVAVATA
ncbi:iron uptake transporter permease EfeU [Rothia aerolata]|uniref:Iron transporter n=1 Tax=Rothia aerolata TaxID=1812262 RepID=A0A917IWL7_9MICC|nr:iron uptake transporter permease EfeU [Rothia aerolata]GGH63795.1 iron transporter [Rothia aerolata]